MTRSILIIFFQLFLFFAAVSTLRAEEYFPMTPSQKHFTAIISQLPGVVGTDWKSPVSLWVKVSSKAVGSPANKDKADTLARILADRGRTALYQPFCVHIYQNKDSELGSQCVY